jgi:hypothetical protein
MQTQVLLEQDDVIIRFPKNLISQETLSSLLNFIEMTVQTQQHNPQNELIKNTDYAFLNDEVWRGETPKDLADNHDLYLYDER